MHKKEKVPISKVEGERSDAFINVKSEHVIADRIP